VRDDIPELADYLMRKLDEARRLLYDKLAQFGME